MPNKLLKYNDKFLKYNNSYLYNYVAPVTTAPAYPTDGLVARWTFDNDDFVDTQNGYVLTGEGTYTFETGKVGAKDVSFGTSGSAGNTTDEALRIPFREHNPYSLSWWSKGPYSTNTWVISKQMGNTYDENQSHTLFSDTWQYARNNYGSMNVNLGSIISSTDWHHYVVTFDGDYGRMYLDASLMLENNTWGLLDSSTNDTHFYIHQHDLGGTQPLEIDNTYLYNKALNQTEIDQLYNGGLGI